MTKTEHGSEHPDSDLHKGAVEEERPRAVEQESDLHSQLDHRSSDPEIKNSDTDFPGPDAKEEHTGEHE